MNWLISFIVGVLVGQEVQNIPRVKPIIQNGFVKTMEYMNSLEQIKQKKQQEPENLAFYTRYYKYIFESTYSTDDKQD